MKTGSLRRILGYTYRYRWSFLISVIGFISFAAADIAAVEWIRRIISYIDSDDESLNTILAMSLIFIAIGRGLGFFIGNYFMSRVGFGIVHDLRAELFQKLHDLPKTESFEYNIVESTNNEISILADGSVYINGKALNISNIKEIEQVIFELDNTDNSIILSAEASSLHIWIVGIMDILNKNGFNEVQIRTIEK